MNRAYKLSISYLFALLTSLLLGCSDLSVFMPRGAPPSLDQVTSISINEEGRLSLAWKPKTGAPASTYQIYLMEVGEEDASLEDFQFSSLALYDAPLRREAKAIAKKKAPSRNSEIVASTKELEITLAELLVPRKRYVLQIEERGRTQGVGKAKAYLIEADFEVIEGATGQLIDGNVTLSWNSVPGANSYEIYADEARTQLLGTTPTNNISLNFASANRSSKFFIRAMKGQLAAHDLIEVSLTESKVSLLSLKSLKPNGLYGVGDKLDFEVKFSEAVTVYGDASLPLIFDQKVELAGYLSGSGTDTLVFRYTVPAGIDSEHLQNGENLSAHIVDANDAKIPLVLPLEGSGSLRDTSHLMVDTTRPTLPTSVGFTSATSRDGNASLSWSPSTDLNFKKHSVKLCSDNGCSIGCGSSYDTGSSSLALSNLDEGLYYGCVRGEDERNQKSDWVASLLPIRVDETAPAVARVYSPTASAYKKAGDTLDIRIEFTEAVIVTGSGLELELDLGTPGRRASYVSGSGTNTLLFSLNVIAGDNSSDLNYVSPTSLLVGGAVVRDDAGNSGVTTLPALVDSRSLAGQNALIVDTTSPTLPSAVTLPGAYANSLSISVGFTAGSDTNFRQNSVKLCTSNDCNTGCGTPVTGASPVTISGAEGQTYYACVRTEDQALNTSAWIASGSAITLDAGAPTVTQVSSSTANGSYKAGDVLSFQVTFSESVNLTNSGDLKLLLNLGGAPREAAYVSGAPGSVLTFSYTVQAGDESSDLTYVDTNSLVLGTATLRDAALNSALTTLPAVGSANSLSGLKDIVVDAIAPTNPSSISFSAPLYNTTQMATSWTASSDTRLNGYEAKLCAAQDCVTTCLAPETAATASVNLTGADGATYYACVRALDTLGNTSAWVASASSASVDLSGATVTLVDSPSADAIYKEGESILIDIHFSENVFVTNGADLSLLLETGATDRAATYVSGSGTATLRFEYDITLGDVSEDLQYQSISALSLGATGDLRDQASNAVIRTLPPLGAPESLAGLSALILDTTSPTPPSLISFPQTVNNTGSFTLNFTQSSDTHFSTHNLKLCGSSDCTTSCLAPTTAVSSPATLSGAHGATYYACVQGEDTRGHLSAYVASSNTMRVDTAAPTVLSVSSAHADGSFKAGEEIRVNVVFSESIQITNQADISLLLETGATDRSAVFESQANSTTLVFTYTVQAGDTSSDLNYQSPSALNLGASGTISDLAGNALSGGLPLLVAPESLAGSKSITIDTTAPAAPVIVSPSDASYQTNAVTTVSGTVAENNAYIEVLDGSTVLASGNAVGNNWSLTLALPLATGSYTLNAKAQDLATNESVASASVSFVVDTTAPNAPVVSALTTPTLDNTPLIQGTSEASMAIEIFADGVSLGSTTANGAGVWSFTPGAMIDGDYVITAVAEDPGSRTSSPSTGVPLSIDTTAPTAPTSVTFPDGSPSASTTLNLAWTGGTDAHLKHFNTKLCTNSNCATGCGSISVATASPEGLVGSDSQTYYGCVQTEDDLGLTSAWVASATPVLIDALGATVVSVSAVAGSDFYTTAETVDIAIEFSEVVNITNSGSLSLALETGATDRNALYVSGGGTDTLVFRYTVLAGDTSADLEVTGINALSLGGSGTIKDTAGNDAILDLPPLAGGSSLSGQANVVIDTTAPAAPTSVGFGQSYSTSTSVPISWSNGVEANPDYRNLKLCSSSDCSTSCGAVSTSTGTSGNAAGVNGQTYYACVQAVDKVGLSSAYVSSVSTITVDTSAPTVARVFAQTANGSYRATQAVRIIVEWSETVALTNSGDLSLTLETGATDRVASYHSQPNPNQIAFEYTVSSGDTSADLDYLATNSLTLGGSGGIHDLAGTAANRTLPSPGAVNSLGHQSAIVIDTTAPPVPSITSHNDGQYVTGAITVVSGTSESGASIELRNGVTVIGSTTAVGTAWSITLGSPLSDGVYNLIAQASDAAGNVGSASAAKSVTVDTSPPNAPLVNAMASPTLDNTPAVSGTSEAGMNITVYANGVSVATTIADGSGNWAANASMLGDGTYAITAKATDAGARESAASNSVNVAIDTTAPSLPSALAFASPYSTSTSVSVTFTPSTDTHFSTHNLKLCTANNCSTGCTSVSTSVTSPASLTGTHGTTYYACAQGVDTLSQASAWVASAGTVTIDTSVPTVTNVSSSSSDGHYKAGDTVNVTITFSESVTVGTGSEIGITLETGATDRRVIYSSGSPGTVLTFAYTVQATDTASDLNYLNTTALTLGTGGTIRDAAGNDATLTLPALGGGSSIATQKAIVIDTTSPTAPSTINPASSYSTTLSFTGSWSGATDTHLNRYETQACLNAACSTSCVSNQSITHPTQTATYTGVNGSSYYICVRSLDTAGNMSAWAASAGTIAVDNTVPSVSGVSSTKNNGSYRVGELIPITVSFSENVYVTNPGDITLTLETGATDRSVLYTSGSGTSTLTFEYTVQTGDTSLDLDYVSNAALSRGASGTIRDLAGNNSAITLPNPGAAGSLGQQKALIIDTTAPAVPAIASPGAYYQSANVSTVSGTSESNASIEVKVNGVVVGTTTASGTSWSYTLSPVLSDGDYTLAANASDAAGNKSADSAGFNIRVDTSGPSAPTINALTSPTNTTTPTISGTTEAGATINVYATGVLKATVVANGAGVWSVPTTALSEGTYTITATATDPGGRVSAASAGQSLTIDTTAPTISSVNSSTANGTYGIGASISIQVNFSSIVNVTNSPILWITYPTVPANYTSGSGTSTLTFTYTPSSGESYADLGYHDQNALALNGGTIRDPAGNNATLTLAGNGLANSLSANKNIVIDAVPPTVTGVTSSNANGNWGPGNVIQISVSFSKNVTVASGTPSLALNTNVARSATYQSGTGTGTLSFSYTIQSGDTSADLNYSSTGALALNGATIRDSVSNNAVLTLPGLAAAGSLATNKNLAIVGNNTAPNISTATASQQAYTGSAIASVNMNHSNGTDNDTDGEALTYSCKFDRTVNGAMDSGGTSCASLPNTAYTFNTSTGVLTWTPSTAAASGYGGYTGVTQYEFEITATDNSNMMDTGFFTVSLIIPQNTAMNFRTSTAADFTYDSRVSFGATTVSLPALNVTDDDSGGSGFGGGGMWGTGWDWHFNSYFKLSSGGGCDGRWFNCFGNGDRTWIPKASNLVSRYGFESTFDDSIRGAGSAFTLASGGTTPDFVSDTVKTGDRSLRMEDSEWMTAPNPVTESFTISYWVNTWDTLIFGDCTQFFQGAGLVIAEVGGFVNDWGTSICDGYLLAGVGNPDTTLTSNFRINDSQWHLVTFTRNKATSEIILYIDGVENARATTTNTSSLNASATFRIGSASSGGGRYLNGRLDEIMFWNAVLTQDDIWRLYYRQSTYHSGQFTSRIMDTTLTSSTLDGFSWNLRFPFGKELPDYSAGIRNETSATYPSLTQTTIMNNLVGLWHFNETAADTAPSTTDFRDGSGQGNNGNSEGTVYYGTPGRFGKSLRLQGAGAVNLGPADALSFGTGNFSASVWVKTNQRHGSEDSSRIISNGFAGNLNGWMVQLRENYPSFGIGCNGGASTACTYVRADKAINDGLWHHVFVVADRTNNLMKIYVDGVQRSLTVLSAGTCGVASGNAWNISGCTALNANRSYTNTLIGKSQTNNQMFSGMIDELAVWGKAMTTTDAVELYKRGAVRLGLQVRVCDDNACVGETWKGPDGTDQTYFTEEHNNTLPVTGLGTVNTSQLSVNFSNFSGNGLSLSTGRYFQYRMYLENEDFNNLCYYGSNEPCSPEVSSVTMGLSAYYDTTRPAIESINALPYYTFSGMTETLGGAGCAGGIRYQISRDKASWYYWNGTSWVSSNGTWAQSNAIATVHANASVFAAQVGRTSFHIKAILNSNGKQACELQTVTPMFNQSY